MLRTKSSTGGAGPAQAADNTDARVTLARTGESVGSLIGCLSCPSLELDGVWIVALLDIHRCAYTAQRLRRVARSARSQQCIP
jgi:hypothetical protein